MNCCNPPDAHRPRPVLGCLLGLLLGLGGCGPADSGFRQLDGSEVPWPDPQGRWTLINYWAVWCKPCMTEVPELNHLAAQHGDRVRVLGVDFDRAEGEALAESADRLGIDFPVLARDPAPVLGLKRPAVLPTTFVFDPAGRLVETRVGPQTQVTLLKTLKAAASTTPNGGPP